MAALSLFILPLVLKWKAEIVEYYSDWGHKVSYTIAL